MIACVWVGAAWWSVSACVCAGASMRTRSGDGGLPGASRWRAVSEIGAASALVLALVDALVLVLALVDGM